MCLSKHRENPRSLPKSSDSDQFLTILSWNFLGPTFHFYRTWTYPVCIALGWVPLWISSQPAYILVVGCWFSTSIVRWSTACIDYERTQQIWLVISTPLKNISQLGWLFPYVVENQKCSKPPTRDGMLVFQLFCSFSDLHPLLLWWSLPPRIPPSFTSQVGCGPASLKGGLSPLDRSCAWRNSLGLFQVRSVFAHLH